MFSTELLPVLKIFRIAASLVQNKRLSCAWLTRWPAIQFHPATSLRLIAVPGIIVSPVKQPTNDLLFTVSRLPSMPPGVFPGSPGFALLTARVVSDI